MDSISIRTNWLVLCHTSSQVAPPPSKMVAGGKQCASRSTITPTKTCSAIVYRRIKRRLGRSLKQPHCKGSLVPSRKQVTHKLPGTKVGLFGSKRVPRLALCLSKDQQCIQPDSKIKQVFDFVGYQKEGWVRPTLDRWQIITTKFRELSTGSTCLIWQLMSLIGLLTATEKQVYLG